VVVVAVAAISQVPLGVREKARGGGTVINLGIEARAIMVEKEKVLPCVYLHALFHLF